MGRIKVTTFILTITFVLAGQIGCSSDLKSNIFKKIEGDAELKDVEFFELFVEAMPTVSTSKKYDMLMEYLHPNFLGPNGESYADMKTGLKAAMAGVIVKKHKIKDAALRVEKNYALVTYKSMIKSKAKGKGKFKKVRYREKIRFGRQGDNWRVLYWSVNPN